MSEQSPRPHRSRLGALFVLPLILVSAWIGYRSCATERVLGRVQVVRHGTLMAFGLERKARIQAQEEARLAVEERQTAVQRERTTREERGRMLQSLLAEKGRHASTLARMRC